MTDLRALKTQAPAAAAGPEEEGAEKTFAKASAGFDTHLAARAQAYAQKYNVQLGGPGADRMDTARGVETWAGVERMEKRLVILYGHKPSLTGSQFVECQGLIDNHETALMAATGESPTTLRTRLLPAVTMTIRARHTPPVGSRMFVSGDLPQFGDGKESGAVELPAAGPGVWEVVKTVPALATNFSYRLFFKELSGAVTWEKPRTNPAKLPGQAGPLTIDATFGA
jgi:hypothetical protein